MTTKPSSAPWADEPFPLIPTPGKNPKYANENHFFVTVGTDMAQVHNMIIRGLNSILLQAPYVPASTSPNYKPQDIKDLLFYVSSWVKTVDKHHHGEESYLFAALDELSGTPGYMDDPKHEHELFHDGLERLLAYAQATKPDEYRWEGEGGMKEILDSFSKDLTYHMHSEIDKILTMGDLDSDGLKKIWIELERREKARGSIAVLYDVFPFVISACDKSYEGGNEFPRLPFILPYLVKYWFGVGNGAWRFSPSDWFSRPRPLKFGPDSQKL